MTVDPRVPPARASYFSRLSLFIPGMLVAATGVGAGDLLTASLAGSRFGLTLLWAAWVGALLLVEIVYSRRAWCRYAWMWHHRPVSRASPNCASCQPIRSGYGIIATRYLRSLSRYTGRNER